MKSPGQQSQPSRFLSRKAWRPLSYIAMFLLVGFVMAPLVAILGASITTSGYWQFPPDGFSLRWYGFILSSPAYVRSLLVSLATACLVVLLMVPLGLAAAMGIVHSSKRVRQGLTNVALLPLLFPELALGIAIYLFFVFAGIPINVPTLALAQLIVVAPLVITLLVIALGRIPRNVESAALDLGASRAYVFRSVTLPMIRGGVTAAMILTFVRSFEDVGIALFVNNSSTMPLSVRMLLSIDTERGAIIAAGGAILLMFGILAIIVVHATVGLERVFGVGTVRGRTRRAEIPVSEPTPVASMKT